MPRTQASQIAFASLNAPSLGSLHTPLQIMDRLLNIKEVMVIFCVKKTALYSGIKKGIFPEPIRLNSRLVRWLLSDVMAFLENSKKYAPNFVASNEEIFLPQVDSIPSAIKCKPESSALGKLEKRRLELQSLAPTPRATAQIPLGRRRSSKR